MTTIYNIRPTTPNVGNDLIAFGLEDMLREAIGSDINFVSIPAAHGSPVKPVGLTARSVYEINQLADGVIIGGGNLFENGALQVDPGPIAALRVPCMLFSVSLGRIYDRTGTLVPRSDSLPADRIRNLCRATAPILARDQATRDHLEKAGVECVQVGGCPVLFITRAAGRLPPPDPMVAGSVLLSLRHPERMSIPASLRGRLYADVRNMIGYLRSRYGQRVQLLCHDYWDLSLARAFPDTPARYTEDPYRFLSWLRDCPLNVTFRLHGFLSCVSLGTPSIHFSYDERAESLIETVGMSDWDVSYVRSSDPLEDLRRRGSELERYALLRERARPRWEQLRQIMVAGLTQFMHRVRQGEAAKIY